MVRSPILLLVAAAPMFSQSAPKASPSFEVASIKPSAPETRQSIHAEPGGRFVAHGVELALMIAVAFRVQGFQIIGAGNWIAKDRWDVEAKTQEGTVDAYPASPPFMNVTDPMAARLRSLLEDRFALKTHRETRELSVYALTVSKGGSKLTAVDPPPEPPGGQVIASAPLPPLLRADAAIRAHFMPPPGATLAGPGSIVASAISISQILTLLGRVMDQPVIDKTGLAGYFNVRLQFDPESAPPANQSPFAAPPADDPPGPSIFTAIQVQLGLKLESTKEPVEVLVIDSAKKPTEN